jgi:hypothetical protein
MPPQSTLQGQDPCSTFLHLPRALPPCCDHTSFLPHSTIPETQGWEGAQGLSVLLRVIYVQTLTLQQLLVTIYVEPSWNPFFTLWFWITEWIYFPNLTWLISDQSRPQLLTPSSQLSPGHHRQWETPFVASSGSVLLNYESRLLRERHNPLSSGF